MLPANGVTCLLYIHSKVDDIGEDTHVANRLIAAAHIPKAQKRLSIFHDESGNNGVKRSFARLIYVGMLWIERKEFTAVLKAESCAWNHESCAHAAEIALN